MRTEDWECGTAEKIRCSGKVTAKVVIEQRLKGSERVSHQATQGSLPGSGESVQRP